MSGWIKIHQIPHVILETTSQFFFNLYITVQVFYTFLAETHQSTKFQTFDCSSEISPNLYIDRLLLLKVYKMSAKKVQRSDVSWYWRVVQNLKKNSFFVSKMRRIWWILVLALKSLKNMHFDWSLLCKVYNVWPKKVQRSYISWHWRVMQSLKKKLTLGLENDMRSLTNFHNNIWECQNWYFHGILWSKVENIWAENLQRIYV